MNHVLPLILTLACSGVLTAADQPAAPPASSAAAATPTDPKGPPKVDPKVDAKPDAAAIKQQASYQVGMQMGEAVKRYQLDPTEVSKGIMAAVSGKEKPMDQAKFQELMTHYQEQLASGQSEGNKTWMDTNGKKTGVTTLPDGLQYEVLASGKGKSPVATDTVKVSYKGTLPDGTVFDASENHGGAVTFPVSGVIKGWTEALLLMKEGDKWRLTVPPALGYGPQGAPPAIPPNQILIFEVELLQVLPAGTQPAPPTPGK